MRIRYYGLIVMIFLLAACSQGGPAADPGPVLTQEPVPATAEMAEGSLSGSAGVNTPIPPACENVQVEDAAAFVDEVIRLTNIERGKAKAPALTEQSQLTQAAQAHVQDMACELFLSHTGSDGSSPFERMTRFGYSYSAAAENVAAGYPTPLDVVKGWMASSGHRTNMLNKTYTQIGIGYAKNTDTSAENNYTHYWAMTLGTP